MIREVAVTAATATRILYSFHTKHPTRRQTSVPLFRGSLAAAARGLGEKAPRRLRPDAIEERLEIHRRLDLGGGELGFRKGPMAMRELEFLHARVQGRGKEIA